MQTVQMWLQYDGSLYNGWQRQPKLPTIQETIERHLSVLLKAPIHIHGSGRTDAGVHALGQCASFKATLILPIEQLHVALNRRLPGDINIRAMNLADEDFHARYSAIGKTYVYKLYTSREKNPFLSRYAMHCPRTLNLEAMQVALTDFIGTHDFASFKASGSTVKTTVRTIESFTMTLLEQDQLVFEVKGDGFLYNMVRIMIGLLVEIGKENIEPTAVPDIILSQNRFNARWTAPACGLYLKEVHY